MQTSRRFLLKSGFVSSAAAVLPGHSLLAEKRILTSSALEERYAKCDAAAALPVFRRELFPSPVIIDSIELLHYKRSWLCRVRSKDGAVGISVSNAQQMEVLYPIFMERIAPFFLGRDARTLEDLVEQVMVFQSNYKATGLAMFVPLATMEFAILDMFGQMSRKPIGCECGRRFLASSSPVMK